MARTSIRDPNQERRVILFGDDIAPVSIRELSRRTKIPENTLRRYKKRPCIIPLDNLSAIVRVRNLSPEEKVRVLS